VPNPRSAWGAGSPFRWGESGGEPLGGATRVSPQAAAVLHQSLSADVKYACGASVAEAKEEFG